MLRRLAIISAFAVALLLIAGILAIVFRADLAETVISSQLAALGAPDARLKIAAFDLDHLEIADIALGREDELRVESITLAYSRGGILAGRLDEVRIDGLRLRIDGSDQARPFGSLQPMIRPEKSAPPEAGGGAVGLIPESIVLSSGRVELALPDGTVVTDLSGRWNPLEDRASVTVSRMELPHVALKTAELLLQATESRLVAAARLESVDDALDFKLDATVDSWREQPTLDFAVAGALRSDAWRIPLWPPEASLDGTFSVDLEGRLPPLARFSEKMTINDWPTDAELKGNLHAAVTDGGYADRAEGLSGTLHLTTDVTNGRLKIEVSEESNIRVAGLDPAWLESLRVPAAIRSVIEAGASLVLPTGEDVLQAEYRLAPAGGEVSLRGAADATAAGTTIGIRGNGSMFLDESYRPVRLSYPEVELRLDEFELTEYRIRKLRFTGQVGGPFDDLRGSGDIAAALGATRIGDTRLGESTVQIDTAFSWDGRHLELRQKGGGSASLASLQVARTARIVRPVSLRLADGSLTLDAGQESISLSHTVTLRPDRTTVEFLRPDRPPIVATLEGGTFALKGETTRESPYRGKIDITGGRLTLPDLALNAADVSASVVIPLPSSGRFADIAVGELSHTRNPAYFAPLTVDGEVEGQRGALVFKASGFDDGGQARFVVNGRHSLEKGDGTLQLELPGVTFGRPGLQPAQLFPVLGAIGEARGRLSGSARIDWSRKGIDSGGELEFEALSFNAYATRVEGLEGRIVLDDLFPLSTPPDQTLTARQIDPAVPLKNAVLRFDIEPASPPRLHIVDAEAQFADGRLTLFETLLDPARERNDFVVGVDRADLSSLIELLNIEDVSGSGRLSGQIPIGIVKGEPVIEGGRLEADETGTLRVRSEAATSALAGAGEQVALMLSALEDFRYDSLSATLDMPDVEDVSIMLRMQGNNPAVLDGYPFAFNINLSGDFTQLIAAVRQGAELSTDLIRPQIR